MPAKIYPDTRMPTSRFPFSKARLLAVLGFGSQGHAHALSLRDSGCKGSVGFEPVSRQQEPPGVAEEYGFAVHDTAEAVGLPM